MSKGVREGYCGYTYFIEAALMNYSRLDKKALINPIEPTHFSKIGVLISLSGEVSWSFSMSGEE